MEISSKNLIKIMLLMPFVCFLSGCTNSVFNSANDVSKLYIETTSIANVAANTTDTKTTDTKTKDGKTITLSDNTKTLAVDSGGRISPFVPYKERNLKYNSMNFGDLPLPPLSGEMDEDLTTLITAKVTGILYDDKSPSAIINVLDDDYLVKEGDKIESFQINKISKDYVAIKTGSNVFRAKVGDIVDGELYGTGVYNLGHKFAGRRHPARKEDVLIVKMKKKASDEVKQPLGISDLTLPEIPELDKKVKLPEIPLPPGLDQVKN